MTDATVAVQHTGRIRTAVRRTRDRAGHAATVAGTAAAVASMYTSQTLTIAIAITIAATGLGLLTVLRPWRSHIDQTIRGTATVLYTGPAVLLIADLTLNRLDGGFHWWKPAAATTWTIGTWLVRPSKLALHLIDQDHNTLIEKTATVLPPHITQQLTAPEMPRMPRTLEEQLQAHWQQYVLTRGIAPGTHLEQPQVGGPHHFSAHIVGQPGYPVPPISKTALSAAYNIPEQLLQISDVPGYGAGRKLLSVSPQPQPQAQADFHTHWHTTVAPKAMPGSTITAIRYGTTKETTE